MALSDGLQTAIEECEVCVFLATKRSLDSRWCMAELGAFWGSKKNVIVYLADPDLLDVDLPPQFRGNLWTSDASKLIEAIKKSDDGLVSRTESGYCLRLGVMSIDVTFGRIEQQVCEHSGCLVALPSNEFFDDDCIHDRASSLGSFMLHNFDGRIAEIQQSVVNALLGRQGEELEKRPGVLAKSYGIGACVYLDRPLESKYRIAMVSVTTQRSDEGLQSEAAYVLDAVRSLQRLMANNRITEVHVPVLGSGHGGLRAEVALLCMLISLGELHRRGSGHGLRTVNIVVFQGSATARPSITPLSIKRALEFVGRFYAS